MDIILVLILLVCSLIIIYQDAWVAKNGPEHQLPGLDFTPNQMFWVSAANVWCAKYRPQVNQKYQIKKYQIKI